MAVVNKLAHYRVRAGFTQKRVAEVMGLSLSTLFSWENGHTFPTFSDLEKLAELYEIHPGLFFRAPIHTNQDENVMNMLEKVRVEAVIAGIDPVAYVEIAGDMTRLTEAEELSTLLQIYRTIPADHRDHWMAAVKSVSKLVSKAE